MSECTEGCGACCRFIVLQVNPQYAQNEDMRRWIEQHGVHLQQKNGASWAFVPTPCEKLTPEGMCSIYGERPDTCRSWPSSQTDIDELHEFLGEEACTVTKGS